MAKKKVQGYLKLQVPAGAANPSPLIGPALGQRGINIMEFCKAFNAKTQDMEKNMPCPTILTIYTDKSFTFEIKKPPVSFYIKRAAKIKKGSGTAGQGFIAKISKDQVKEIATEKMPDLNAKDLEGAMLQVEGSARSMGIEVVGG